MESEVVMRKRYWFSVALLFLVWIGWRDSGFTAAAAAVQAQAEQLVPLPNKDGSLKFAVLGDFGTGDRPQYELAQQMISLHERFKYDLVALVGDNLYGSERPQDFK